MTAPESGYGPGLFPQHAALLYASGIATDVAAARGYRSVDSAAALGRLGFAPRQRLAPALAIPVWGVTGDIATYQIRPDVPRVVDGKALKYETPSGTGLALDVPSGARRWVADPSRPLFVTEGARKADAAVSQGLCCIAVLGVWAWRGTNEWGGKTALPDWELVALDGRDVYVVFDSDVMMKRPVALALARLKGFLELHKAHVRVIYLPSGPGGTKVGLDDFLATRESHPVDDLLALAESDLRRSPAPEPAASDDAAERPRIIVNGRFMREITADAVAALERSNSLAAVPLVFRRGTALARLVRTDRGPSAEALQNASLKGILDRAADFVSRSVGKDDDEERFSPERPPSDVVSDLLTLGTPPFPHLREILSVPVFLPDGSLLAADGYHADSGYLLALRDLDGVRTDMPIDAARHLLLDELLADFPFADAGSRAHTLAMLLQPFARPLIDGPTPLYLVEAPRKGTGKGLLVDVLSEIATGALAAMMTLSRDEDEVEKRITALLMGGASVIVLDNVGTIRSATMAAALRAAVWRGRILGRSEMVALPNTALWVATGNNVELSDEITRRVAPIRLDAAVEHPEDRTEFRHALPAWAVEHRAELVSAGLSLVRAWLDAGRPVGGAVLGGFERWTAVMGGILDVAGVEGVLTNRGALRARADRESAEWGDFLDAWWERFGDHPATPGELLEVASEQRLLLDIWAGRSKLGAAQRFGHALASRRDQVIGYFRVRSGGTDARTHNAAWRLERMAESGATPETPETKADDQERGDRPGVPGVSGVAAAAVRASEDVSVDMFDEWEEL